MLGKLFSEGIHLKYKKSYFQPIGIFLLITVLSPILLAACESYRTDAGFYMDQRYKQTPAYKSRSAASKANSLGWAHYEKGEFEEAIKYFTEAISSAPSMAVVYRNRSMAYERTGKMDMAIKDQKQYLQLSSDPEGVERLKALTSGTKVQTGQPETPPIPQTGMTAVPEASKTPQVEPPATALPAESLKKKEETPPVREKLPLGTRVALVIGNADYKESPLRKLCQ
jgi:tetratricopeptide (TPR) repeat protein